MLDSVRAKHVWHTLMNVCRDIAYEAADKELEAGEAEFTINIDELTRACNSNPQIAAKAGAHDQAPLKNRRRGGGATGPGHDADDSGQVAIGKLQGRQKPDVPGFDTKRPAGTLSTKGNSAAKGGISRARSGV